MLAQTFAFVTILTVIGYCQLFAEPYVLTQGGPANSTLSLVLLMYQEGFRWWNMGAAAAVAVVLFAIILGLTLLQLRVRSMDGAWQSESRDDGSPPAGGAPAPAAGR
jgi:multiple sugar transport system permease protein